MLVANVSANDENRLILQTFDNIPYANGLVKAPRYEEIRLVIVVQAKNVVDVTLESLGYHALLYG